MKKLTALFLAGAMALSLAACGKPAEPTPAPQTSQPSAENTDPTPAPVPEEKGKITYIIGFLGDKSMNDSGYVGIQTLESQGYEVQVIETNSQADKYADYVYDAIDGGADYIVTSSGLDETVAQIAPEYKDVKFILFDMTADYVPSSDNIFALSYAQNEGSFLVGMVAAAMTKSGVVAVNVGKDSPTINDFVVGFVEGVNAYNPETKVVKGVVGSWSDPAAMKTLCETQYRDQKADVFYQVAGGSGAGAFEFAVENDCWCIGVDSDQYTAFAESENPELAEVIVTSMLKEVGNSLVNTFASIEDGSIQWGTTLLAGLADNAVGYVDNDFFRATVPADVVENISSIAAKVVSGEMSVKSYFNFDDETEFNTFLQEAGK